MVFVHLAEGFEEVEALTTVDVLRRAEIEVKTVSVTGSTGSGAGGESGQDTGRRVVTGSHGIPVVADLSFEEADYDFCDMIMLPGGMPGSVNLRDHEGLCSRIKEFHAAGKQLAAICAAPMVLGACGVLKGSRATIYPGMENELVGATATGEDVTCWENIITGKGPGLAMAFALQLVETLAGKEKRDEVAKGLLY